MIHDFRTEEKSKHLKTRYYDDEQVFEVLVAVILEEDSLQDRRHQEHDTVVDEAG